MMLRGATSPHNHVLRVLVLSDKAQLFGVSGSGAFAWPSQDPVGTRSNAQRLETFLRAEAELLSATSVLLFVPRDLHEILSPRAARKGRYARCRASRLVAVQKGASFSPSFEVNFLHLWTGQRTCLILSRSLVTRESGGMVDDLAQKFDDGGIRGVLGKCIPGSERCGW